jgi:quinoprotein glucose dehydrogenase
MPDARALDAYLYGLGTQSQPLREAARKAIQAISAEVLPEIEKRIDGAGLSPQTVAQLQKIYPKEKSPRLHRVQVRKLEPAAYLEFALRNAGDAARGKRLFADPKGVACAKCHRVAGEGGEVGPDLSGIGLQYPKKELAEQVLFPSQKVREGYQQVIVRTKDGLVASGAVKSESAEELVLVDAEARIRRLRKTDIDQRKASALSLMPEGLAAGFSLQDFADLLAYLESLKSPPK